MAEVIVVIKEVLEKIAKEHNFVNYNITIEPICSKGANYSSTLYNVTIKENGNTHNLFAKFATLGEKIRSENPEFYQKEIFAYTKLAKVYDTLQDEHQVVKKHRLSFTKFYGCNTTRYKEVLVLENLVAKGYQLYDRFKSIDWKYATAAVTELGKMHALSFAYSNYHPEDFSKVIDELNFEWSIEKGNLSEHFEMASARAVELVQESTRDQLKRFFDTFEKESFPQFYVPARRPVLAHLDYRPSNLMYRICDDGSVKIKVVDLQSLQGCSPVLDLLYFIVTGTDEKFRAQYYEKLKDHYYTELEAAMKRLHLEPEKVYSRADFEYELEEKLPFGLVMAVMILPVVTVSTENAPAVNDTMAMTDFSVEPTNHLYTERLNGIVNDYIKWGIL